jgi:ammonium transporter, Amt family
VSPAAVNSGDTSWVLFCTAAVLFMTPGLALFYAGMVSRRNTLVMLQQNIIPLGVISLTWVIVGYSLAFGDDTGSGVIADLELFGLRNLGEAPPPALHKVSPDVAIPTLAFVAYQMMFAVITPALATGAVASRLRPLGWAVFLAAWSILVYPPIAHWLWAPAGWLTSGGAQDWAGGMVVHASAGAAALALLVVLGRRRVWPDRAPLPHSVPFVVAGGAILWFGWFGFNAGDGLQANGVAAQALVNTQVAAAAAMIVWLLVERFKDGHATVLGAVTGAVGGLATITPAAGYVNTTSAVVIGALAGGVCHIALRLKALFRYDDALDVIAVHFVGGVLGSLLVGLFGEEAINSIGADGLLYGGGFGLLGEQVLALVAVIAFSFVLTWLIATAVERTIGLRVAPDDEERLDEVQQGMQAYDTAPFVASSRAAADFDGSPVPASVQAGPDLRLVSAVVDGRSMNDTLLTDSLLHAGALRIVGTDAHVYTASADPRVVRGQRRQRQATARTRLEILTVAAQVGAVAAVLSENAGGPVEVFVQAADTAK